jgi:CheY-like chemotaxis protein
MLRRLIGEHLELDIHTASGVGTIEGDRGQIEQILMNLCVNARDAMSGGGRLRIETGNVRFSEADLATRPWARAGEFVRLRVSDTGCGIPPEVRERIFEPFFTTKEMGHGTGLGLATVYAITERHQGFLDVETEPGRGTTLEVYFPVRRRPAREAKGGGGEDESEGGSETILLAEDDDQVAELAQTILEDVGYRVLLARNGREAIELFHGHADEIAVAVLDVVMPGKSGRAVYDEIVRTRPGVPVLFTTGYSGDALATDGMPDDAFEILPKPFGPRELLARVRAMLSR